jgi:hypothetical protein
MKLQSLFEKLEKSDIYQNFRKESPNAFFCAGFIILNFKQNFFEYSLDYRDQEKVYAFKIPSDEKEKILFTADKLLETPKPLEQINEVEAKQIKLDIEDLKNLLEEEMWNNNIKNALDEAIAVLQSTNGKIIWNITCICSNLLIINVELDPFTKKTLRFEKKSLMDFMSLKKVDKK